MKIGKKIKELRKEKGITQEQLGSHLKVSYQAISKWENGDSMPDIGLLVDIANYFSVTTDELLDSIPNRDYSGYERRVDELLTIYECGGSEEDFQRAITAYNEIFLHGTPMAKDYAEYAYIYDIHAKRSVDKAIQYYQKAIEKGKDQLDDDWYKAHNHLNLLLIRSNRSEEAIRNVLAWLEKEPDKGGVYISAAIVYRKCGDVNTAYKYIKEAEKISPNDSGCLCIVGDLCKDLGKYDEAIAYWDKGYAVEPQYCSCLYSKVFLFEELGDKEKALEVWKEILEFYTREGCSLREVLKPVKDKIAMLSSEIL
ncbi:MAG: helix-turn-helix domain-containing protein [Cellulosilyticaceae bacterium]